MELHETYQLLPEELNNLHFDLFISVLGYEKRGVYLIEKYNIHADRKICLAHSEKKGLLNRSDNELIFRQNGFEIINVSGEQIFPVDALLKSICTNRSKVIRILVDYSSMTKVWYSGIINNLSGLGPVCNKIEVYFSYTPALFDQFKKQKPAKLAYSVVSEKRKPLNNKKPLALIIGLGLNNLKAEMLIKSVKPSVVYLFYADPAHSIDYVQRLFKNNQSLIESTDIRNLHNFPLKDLEATSKMLTKLCLDLRLRYNILIAPVGPKVFTLITLILANRYPDIDVWRVSAGTNEPAIDRIGDGDPLIYAVDFVNDLPDNDD